MRRQREVRSEDAHACPREVPRGQADCACLQRGRNEGKNCQAQSRKRAEEAALLGLMQTWSVLGRGFNQLRTPSQARRGGSLETIVGKHCSTERPRIQTLLTQLAELKMAPGEKVTDYLTRAEGIRLNFQEAGEMTAYSMFSTTVLKGLPPTFESIATVLDFGRRKGYEEMKQDLINVAITRAEPGLTWLQLPSTQAGQQQEEDHVLQVPKNGLHGKGLQVKGKQGVLQVPKNGLHGKGLQVKGKQGVLQVQCGGPSCKELQEQEGAVQWQQQRSREQGIFSFRSVERLQRKKDSSYW